VGLPSQGRGGIVEFTKLPTYWKITLKTMTGNVVISEVDALMYVVLSEAAKHAPYGKVVGTTKCITCYPKFHTNRGCYDQVQL
jgi:hypothetical protein